MLTCKPRRLHGILDFGFCDAEGYSERLIDCSTLIGKGPTLIERDRTHKGRTDSSTFIVRSEKNEMTLIMLKKTLLTLTAIASLIMAKDAHAFDVSVTDPNAVAITSMPYNITQSGHYYLANDIILPPQPGWQITISAHNVVLDLNNHMIVGLGGLNSYGILINGQENVTVKDGFLNDGGFAIAVYLNNCHACTVTGIQALTKGEVPITDNDGTDNHIVNCDVGLASPITFGIWLINCGGDRVEGNQIRGAQSGIVSAPSQGNIIRNNNISSSGGGTTSIQTTYGLYLSPGDVHSGNTFAGSVANQIIGGQHATD